MDMYVNTWHVFNCRLYVLFASTDDTRLDLYFVCKYELFTIRVEWLVRVLWLRGCLYYFSHVIFITGVFYYCGLIIGHIELICHQFGFQLDHNWMAEKVIL